VAGNPGLIVIKMELDFTYGNNETENIYKMEK